VTGLAGFHRQVKNAARFAEIRSGGTLLNEGGHMDVSDARARYLAWIQDTKTLSPHTVRAYQGDILSLERAVRPRLRPNECEVRQISSDLVIDFVSTELRLGASPSTVIRRCSGLRGFFKWLSDSGLIETDPWSAVRLEIRKNRSLPRAVASHDLHRLLSTLQRSRAAATSDRSVRNLSDRATLVGTVLLLVTGMRVGELVSLRLVDVDVEARTICVLGKGRRERQVYLPENPLISLVKVYVQDRASVSLAHDRLLVSTTGAPMSTAVMRSRLTKAGRDAAVSVHLTPHMLRHSAATQLIEAGVDIRFVQRLLGHASLSTTEIYTHVSDAALRRVVGEADVLGRIHH
jgi:site-specific recombinase XerD